MNEIFVNRIYIFLKMYNPLLEYFKEDAKQEIRIAIIEEKEVKKIYKASAKNIHKLCKDYGFSRKKGKDNFATFYEDRILTKEQLQKINKIEDLYLNQNLTAREVCEVLEVEYNKSIAKILCKTFPKGLGLGGKRKNAGRNLNT